MAIPIEVYVLYSVFKMIRSGCKLFVIHSLPASAVAILFLTASLANAQIGVISGPGVSLLQCSAAAVSNPSLRAEAGVFGTPFQGVNGKYR